MSAEQTTEQMALFDDMATKIRGQMSAAWWIDHRAEGAPGVIRATMYAPPAAR